MNGEIRYYSITDVASIVGYSREAIWRGIKDGEIAAIRPLENGSYRIPRSEVERMLEPVAQAEEVKA